MPLDRRTTVHTFTSDSPICEAGITLIILLQSTDALKHNVPNAHQPKEDVRRLLRFALTLMNNKAKTESVA